MFCYSKIKVRYAETDQMGVVYYANYFVWMEVGRTDLLRNTGLTYKELEESGYALPVISAYARYYLPASYDDDIEVVSAIVDFSGPKLKIGYKIYKDKKLICEGYTEHVFISISTKKPAKPPEKFLEVLKKSAIEKSFIDF
jgi:acyl-CoA thioester hydrolase